MTNGEKMQEVFPEGETRKCRDGVVFESDGWCHAYNSDWWNAEYKEPTTKNNLTVDCIDKAEFIGKLENATTIGLLPWQRAIIYQVMEECRPVTPQPKKGHWIKGYTFPDGEYWKCDKCNELIKVKYPMYYCNNCGSDNREVEE